MMIRGIVFGMVVIVFGGSASTGLLWSNVSGKVLSAACQKPEASALQLTSIDDTIKVIQGLRNRRLFDLADIYCQQQLDSESISTLKKSSIVLEQIQTKVAEAIVASGKQRESAWSQANDMINQFDARFPNHPQRLLIQVQDALVYYSRGNLIRQEIAAEISPASMKQDALNHFRKATSAFTAIENEIKKTLPQVANRTVQPGNLSAEELTNLKNNIRYRLALINLAKAQLFDASDRLNQVDALNQVLARLDQVITQSNSEVPLWWKSQIARANCFRLKQDASAFGRLLSSLPEAEISVDLQNDWLTERLLASIDFKQTHQYDKLLKLFNAAENPTPELQLAALKLLMSQASRLSGDPKKLKQADATRLVSQIEATQGAYWGRRAEVLLVDSVDASSGDPTASSDFEILIRQGESAFRKQNFADAAKAFDRALQFAVNADSGERALQVAVRFAGCHEALRQHEIAASKLLETSMLFQDEKLADAVHLRGCWNLGRANSEQEQVLVRLNELVKTWPDSSSTDQAWLWLGSAHQNHKRYGEAISAYNSIPFNSSHALKAIEQIEPCATALINAIKNRGGDWKTQTRELVSQLRNRLEDQNGWNDVRRRLLSAMLGIGLPAGAISPSDAIQWLQSAGDGDVSDWWRRQSKILELLATSMDSSMGDAIAIIKNLPNDAVVMRECFDQLSDTLNEKQFDAISDSRIMICDKALTDQNVADREFWQIERLIAKVAGPSAGDAMVELKGFAAKYPKSLKVQLAYARAMTGASDNHEEALKQWRRLALKVPQESDSWFEAKYNVVAVMIASGKRDEAEKLIKYLQVSTSTLDDSPWKSRFEKLLK